LVAVGVEEGVEPFFVAVALGVVVGALDFVAEALADGLDVVSGVLVGVGVPVAAGVALVPDLVAFGHPAIEPKPTAKAQNNKVNPINLLTVRPSFPQMWDLEVITIRQFPRLASHIP